MFLPKNYAEHDTQTDQQNHLTSQFLYSALYKTRYENLAEDLICRPLHYVHDDFPKSCSHRRPDAGTLETIN